MQGILTESRAKHEKNFTLKWKLLALKEPKKIDIIL